jgi:hypothetical protein
MDQPIRWTLPAPAFVTFDSPLSVATVDGGLDPAYADFLRESFGLDVAGGVDAPTLSAAADRLASTDYRASWADRSDRPRDPIEFGDLTRLLRAVAAADGSLGGSGATIPSYPDDDELRSKAMETAAKCPDCTQREFAADADGTAATMTACCEPHHRDLHRAFVQSRESEDHPTPSEAFDLANRLEHEALAIDAASDVADVAAYDPHAVRPVVDQVLAEFESHRGAEMVNVEYLRELTRALTHLGLVDGSVRARLVRSLADDDARIRQASAAAVASLAWERPESLLAVGDDAVPTGYLKQVFGDDDEPVDEEPLVVRNLAAMLAEDDPASREQSLAAIREFARTHPNAVYPLAEALTEPLDDPNDAVRFYAAVAVANLAARYPEVGVDAREALHALAARTDDPASVPASLALADALDASVDRDDAIDRAVAFADPSRYPERVVREAVHALGRLDALAAVDLDWIDACATESALSHAVAVVRGDD